MSDYILPKMSYEEYQSWEKYIEKRNSTLGNTAIDYCRAAEMFLNHFRRGIDLTKTDSFMKLNKNNS